MRRIFAGNDVDFPPATGSGDIQNGEWWFEQAVRYSRPLEPRKFDHEVHDHGFMFLSTYLSLVPAHEGAGV